MDTKVTAMIPKPDPDNYDLDKPSDRIEFALEAMKWWESLPKAQIHMSIFRGKFSDSDTCYACCGGAALCAVEGWTPDNFVTFEEKNLTDFEDSLDDARGGRISRMFDIMGLEKSVGVEFDRRITHYQADEEAFYSDMYKLVDDLRAGGY